MFTYFRVGNPGWHFLFPALRRSCVTNHSVVVVYAFVRFCVFQLFNYLQIKKGTVLVLVTRLLRSAGKRKCQPVLPPRKYVNTIYTMLKLCTSRLKEMSICFVLFHVCNILHSKLNIIIATEGHTFISH